jgi:hypothetical protein
MVFRQMKAAPPPVGLNRWLDLVTTPLIFTGDSIPVAVHFCSGTILEVEGGFFTRGHL